MMEQVVLDCLVGPNVATSGRGQERKSELEGGVTMEGPGDVT